MDGWQHGWLAWLALGWSNDYLGVVLLDVDHSDCLGIVGVGRFDCLGVAGDIGHFNEAAALDVGRFGELMVHDDFRRGVCRCQSASIVQLILDREDAVG